MNGLFNNSMPLVWIVAGITALIYWRLILRESRRLKAKERFERLQCVHCGYDLRASDQRCPECGFPIQAPDLPLTMTLDLAALQTQWPTDHQETRIPRPDECRVDVYAGTEGEPIHLLAQQLQARGISARVSVSHSRRVDPVSLMTVEYWDGKLAVWSGDVERATEIIQEFSQASIARKSPNTSTVSMS